MNRTTKIILIAIASLFVLGIIAIVGVAYAGSRFVAKSMTGDPGAVQEAAAKIADLELPEGYRADYAVNMAGFTMAAYNPGDGHSHLMLIQFPSGAHLDEAEMRRQVGKVARNAGRNDYDGVKMVAQVPVTIRGQQVTATINEGVSSDGQPFRMAVAAFEGKSGPALVMLEEPIARWDQARMDALFASMR